MKKSLIIIGLVGAILTHSLVAVASDAPIGAGASPEQEKIKAELLRKLDNLPVSECKDTLSALMDNELKEFLDFLDQTFQNKSSNSSLTNLAIAKYSEYKTNIDNLFSRINVNDEVANIVAANNAYGICAGLVDEYYAAGKKILFDHIKQNTSVKTTAILLEKYQAINSKLRDLNMTISQMFGYFSTFKAVFPGFLKQCITSG